MNYSEVVGNPFLTKKTFVVHHIFNTPEFKIFRKVLEKQRLSRLEIEKFKVALGGR